MRWDSLFDDLEGQLERELEAEDADLHAEEERLRLGRLTLRDRLAALAAGRGAPRIRFGLGAGDPVVVEVATVGRDWLSGARLIDGRTAGGIVLPLGAVTDVTWPAELMPASLAAPVSGGVTERLGLAFVLRDLCRRRARVRVDVVGAAPVTRSGTIDRVGRDHLDLAEHPVDEARRGGSVLGIRAIPFGALQCVHYS